MNTKHLHVVCTLALTVVLSFESEASTIICLDSKLDTPGWVAKHLREADVVLLGRVIAEETSDRRPAIPTPNQSATSMKELLELIEKGSKPDYETSIYQGVPLQVGKTYLLFGHKQEGSIYTISTVCGYTLDEESAQERIVALNEVVEAAKSIEGEPH